MNYDLQHSDLSTVLAEGRLVADETKRVFGQLSAEQVNWKPSEGEWSIGQCFDHLIISNRPYLTIIEKIQKGTSVSVPGSVYRCFLASSGGSLSGRFELTRDGRSRRDRPFIPRPATSQPRSSRASPSSRRGFSMLWKRPARSTSTASRLRRRWSNSSRTASWMPIAS